MNIKIHLQSAHNLYYFFCAHFTCLPLVQDTIWININENYTHALFTYTVRPWETQFVCCFLQLNSWPTLSLFFFILHFRFIPGSEWNHQIFCVDELQLRSLNLCSAALQPPCVTACAGRTAHHTHTHWRVHTHTGMLGCIRRFSQQGPS